ncbi:MAG: GNAT family N-acetyltransferase [Elusimicrobiota bacterium]
MDILLREVADGDVPVFFEHQTDPEAIRMVAHVPRDKDAFTAHWVKIGRDPAVSQKAIVFEGKLAGYVGSFERNGKREVCYWLGRDFWGKGIATAGLRAFLDEEKRRPLWALAAKRNPASARVLEKCGFKIVGEDSYANALGERIEEFVLKLENA